MKKSIKQIDIGHLLLVLFMAGWVSWYLYDAYTASSNIQNIILIVPAGILALILCFIILLQIIFSGSKKAPDPNQILSSNHTSANKVLSSTPTQGILKGILRYRILAFMISFGLYVGLLEIIGFDVATYLFIGFVMLLQGERRIWVIIVYSLVFGTSAIWLFGLMIPYPVFTLLVPIP